MVKQISLYGATGFIGSNFSKLKSIQIDQVDRDNPNPQFQDVIYAIGTTDNYNIFKNPTLDIETNLIKLIKDLEILRKKFGTFTINYLSSWFVYGDAQPPPFKVSNNCNPKGFYSISKYAAENFLISYCLTYKINYRILRLSNIYGVNDKGISAKKNALQFLINQIKLNKTIELYGGGNFLRDYLDVRDAVTAIDLIVNKGSINKIYNVGSGKPTLFIALMEKARDVFNSSSKFLDVQAPEFHQIVQVRDSHLDISDLSELGFIPKYDIVHEIINL
jgi:nucleoside-diphosphate-sugar epimerase